MSRDRSKPGTGKPGNRRFAALHPQPDGVYALCLEMTGSGCDVESLRFIDCKKLSAEGVKDKEKTPAQIASLLSLPPDWRVRAAVTVLPAADFVLRTVTLTLKDDDDFAAAIDLQCEALLPENIPSWRRGGVVIRSAGEQRQILLVGWPEHEHDRIRNSNGANGSGAMYYTPDAAALAQLVRLADSDETTGSAAAALFYHPGRNSLALLLAGEDASSVPVRGVRLPAGVNTGEAVTGTLRETAALLDDTNININNVINEAVPALPADSTSARMYLDEHYADVLRAVAGKRAEDEDFARHYGTALAAAAGLACSHDPSSAFTLQREPAAETVSPPAKLINFFADKRRAVTVIVACLVILLLLPLAAAGVRLALLRSRVGDASALREKQQQTMQTLTLYRAMAEHRWPMSKLLADVSAAAPVGVEVETLTLATGEQLQLSGLADSLDVLIRFQENLNRTRIFGEVQLPRRDVSDNGKVDFTLRAAVVHPYLEAQPAEDFAAETLQKRLYGETDEDNAAPPDNTTAAAPGTNGRQDSNHESADSARAQPQNSQAPPDPLTAEQMTGMSREELRKALVLRLKLKSRPYDDVTKKRLADEINMLKTEMKKRR